MIKSVSIIHMGNIGDNVNAAKFDTLLPFFSYGIFRPGEIAFLGIRDFVDSVSPLIINGSLMMRDGVLYYKTGSASHVDGYLITFKTGKSKEAYDYINDLEPHKLYKWKELGENGNRFNILEGRCPNNGNPDSYNEHETQEYSSIWNDPFFNAAFEVLRESVVEDIKDDRFIPLFRYQMKYLLLWTILERFAFLRYSLGANPSKLHSKLGEDKYFKEGLRLFVNNQREIYKTQDPSEKYSLNKEIPKKSIDYYYQVRCNITHRGKALHKDRTHVEESFNELLKITQFIIKETKKECDECLNNFI